MDIKPLAILGLSSALIACGGSSSSDNKDDNLSSGDLVTIDASSYTGYQYFDLNSMTLVTPADPQSDTTWDIAFRRSGIILNGGVSGPADVSGALAVAQDQFYDDQGEPVASVFINATADNEGETAFNTSIDSSSLSFSSDQNSNAITSSGDNGWYSYNPATHIVSINADNWWIIRNSAANSFTKFHASTFTSSGRSLSTLTIGYFLQADGSATFSENETTATIDLSDGNDACFDFDSNSDIACDQSGWDLRVAPDFTLWLNSEVYGQGQGAIAYGTALAADDSTLTDTTSGSQVQHWVADSQAGIFKDNSWYGYNFQQQHQLWPNYRVYLVKDSEAEDANLFKLQIRSYYNADRQSGNLTLKIAPLN